MAINPTTIEQYRHYIITILSERAEQALQPTNASEYEVQTVFDQMQDSLPTFAYKMAREQATIRLCLAC